MEPLMPRYANLILIAVVLVVIALALTGCGKFNPPWGGSRW
jgi:hypothetical protein